MTNPLEQDLEIDQVKKMTSVSRENGSTIIIQLDHDQTAADQAERYQEVIDKATDLSDDAEDLIILLQKVNRRPPSRFLWW